MDLDLIIPSAVAVIAIGLYVIALWIGDHKTISTMAGASNFMAGIAIVAIGLSAALGVRLTISLLTNPHSWVQAISNIIHEI